MYEITTLKSGLTLITAHLPALKSVTALVAVGAGSRYETRKINGISHFLEHMFFKGSKKYPTAQEIATLVDSIGAINNAATDKEITYYWIKCASGHVELASDILSSMLKESLLEPQEIEKEKGVIVEELRMYKDTPSRYIWDLYEQLQFGDQPLGWQIGGDEKTVLGLNREDFVEYMQSLYSAANMALVFVGNLPKNIKQIAEKYFDDLPKGTYTTFKPYENEAQNKPKVHLYHKKTDQANLVLGVQSYSRDDEKRYAARVLGIILGEGMSSRLFSEIREKRGLAYHVASANQPYKDTGAFVNFAGMKLEKVLEGVKVIRDELEKMASKKVGAKELQKAKEMERGRIALRMESTNFLAEHFGVEYILDRKLETFEDYLKKIDAVSSADILEVARELFVPQKYNLEIIAPLDDPNPFIKALS